MSDREEIRWKFQQLQEVIVTSRLEHEKERENKLQDWHDLYHQSTSGRNTILGGMGFVILLIVALASIDDMFKEHLWLIVLLIVIGLTVFILTNVWLTQLGKRTYKIDEVYEEQILELIGVESWFIGWSLQENVTREQLTILVYFIHDYTQALSYLLKDRYYKIYKQENTEHENFKNVWNTTKSNYSKYADINTDAKKQIEKFIKLFEENEKEINAELSKSIKEIK